MANARVMMWLTFPIAELVAMIVAAIMMVRANRTIITVMND